MAKKKPVPPQPQKVRFVRLEEIEPTPGWEEIPDSDPRLLSIQKNGQLQPVHLVKDENGLHIIEDGARRISCLRKLGKNTCQAIVEDHNDHRRSLNTLIHNLQRNNNPAREAEAVALLQDEGMTLEEITQQTGIPVTRIRQVAAYREKLDTSAFEALKEGRVREAAAKKLTNLPKKEQKKVVKASEGQVREKDVASALRAHKTAELELDTIDVPPVITRYEALADELDTIAQGQAGTTRKLLVDAAAVLRSLEKGEGA